MPTVEHPIAALHGVGLRYATNQPVLHDAHAILPRGAFRWLLGPSGAGKTSLLQLLSLATRPTTGELHILGTRIGTAPRASLPALRRQIGTVFQDVRLLPHLSAFDNVALPLRLAPRLTARIPTARIQAARIRADVNEMLHWVGLGPHAARHPAELSGGEQQRVAIARAVIARPALLLADEPTGNLDAPQAHRLMQLLTELNRLGTTIVVATHNAALVAAHPAPAWHLLAGRLHAPDPVARQADAA